MLLIIGVSVHLGWVSGVLFEGKVRSRLLLEGLGVKGTPNLTPSKQNRRSSKIAQSSQQGKWAWHQRLGIMYRALQATPSLLTYLAPFYLHVNQEPRNLAGWLLV